MSVQVITGYCIFIQHDQVIYFIVEKQLGILYGACAKLSSHAKHAHETPSYVFGKLIGIFRK